MLLGGNVFIDGHDPDAYVAAHVKKGYKAAYCPDWLNTDTDKVACKAFTDALNKNNIVLAEVGIWRNVLSKDSAEAKAAIDYSIRRLTTAEELGARCAVNVIGSWSEESWDGASALNYTQDFFDAAVVAARQVIDAVKPVRTKMTFELMPNAFIDSAEEYMRLLKAIDRPAAGIHLDPTNCIASPRLLYNNAEFFKKEFAILGDAICSIHIKDIDLDNDTFTVHLTERIIGEGAIDYINLLHLIDKLPQDTPVMLEHLATEAEYDKAAENFRSLAKQAGINM
ncbi:MAG: sugar phosphate isomerase/epimerase [Spirochaetaceae bacterium]|jgi:sugar phosphate isomerase/epimerase|nr:sugar phosphate isomerase/epimerase [Spirochaetaceae bacterium]